MKKNIFNLFTKSILTTACFLTVITIISCPIPLNEKMFLQVTDEEYPLLVISSPEDGAFCTRTMVISGIATDSVGDGSQGNVAQVEYEVLATSLSGSIVLDDQGHFDFQLSTESLGAAFVLKITVTDWNGNSSSNTLSLYKQEGDEIPSFVAVSGNSQVTTTWNMVPGASSYTVYYTTNGTIPSENYYAGKVENAISPFTLNNCTNGSVHGFLLEAVYPAANSSWSDPLQVLPLSSQSLAPMVSSGFDALTVTWPPIPADISFEVWRSTDRNSGFVNISGPLTRDWFEDNQISPGTFYFYKVLPSIEQALNSDANCATACPFPDSIPKLVGSCDSYGIARKIVVRDNRAYVAADAQGMVIYDISEPTTPTLLSHTGSPRYAKNIALSGDYAFVASDTAGLRIHGIANSSSPTFVGSYDIAGYPGPTAYDVVVRDDYAYVAFGESGLVILDISSPDTPLLVGSCDTPNEAMGIAINGDYAYVADKNSLQIINIFTPDAPSVELTYPAPVGAWNIAVAGAYVYLAGGTTNRLTVLEVGDLSSPSAPILITQVPDTLDPAFAGRVLDIAVDGNYVYVAAQSEVHVLNMATPSSPLMVGTEASEYASGIALSGRHAFIADWSEVTCLDITCPSSPQVVSTLPTPSSATDVAVTGNIACVSYWKNPSGMHIYNIADPENPTLIANGYYGSGCSAVAVNGTTAYLACSSSAGTLVIVDISDPEAPVQLANFNTDSFPSDVVIRGNYAYVADLGSLQIVDVSVSTAPFLASSAITPGVARGVVVEDDYAYVADGSSLTVISVADPRAPIQVHSHVLGGNAEASKIAFTNDHLFVAAGDAGLLVFNILDPTEPSLTFTYDDSGSVWNISTYADFALVSSGTDLIVLNISNPDQIYVESSIPALDGTAGVTTSGSFAYLADGDGGFKVIRLTQ